MKINESMKVAEIFERYPQTQQVFQKFGFGALMNPVLRKTFGMVTSVEVGCRFHGVDLGSFLKALNDSLTLEQSVEPGPCANQKIHEPEIQKILKMKTKDLVKIHPDTEKVFIKHFGPGCFSCPAFGQEDVAFACSMHNTNPVVFAEDCLQLIPSKLKREK